ncbi:MAG: hypothetical protein ACJ74T_18940, partial [Pyrinomonadaceae bacterium]
PQIRPSKQPQTAVTPTGSDSESLPVRGARLNGIQATARESATQDATTPPIIEVTIGRIEVRAVPPPAPPPPPQRARQAPPKMSLDDYLRAQSGGRR